MDYAKESPELHRKWRGKIRVKSAVPVESSEDLSLAYTNGVAQPCLEIQKDILQSYELTRRHNLCAVITGRRCSRAGRGRAVRRPACPSWRENASVRKFGDVHAFPLCVKSEDVDEFVNAVALISGSFRASIWKIISAPRCFEIERKLKEKTDIPIFHDDQHGTAIITLAGLMNALKLTAGKKLGEVKIVTSGAGAARGCHCEAPS